MRKLLLVLFVAVILPNLCWGWGREGHRIIARVAEDHLDETTKVMIQSLIGNNHLYSIAPWADEVRPQQPHTKTWHYVNIPLSGHYDPARDCAPPGCVVGEINQLRGLLTDKTAAREVRAEGLKYVVHFVADLHQPMHAVKEAKGGNGIHVSFLNSSRCGPYDCNLHGVWDTSMILRTGLTQDNYAAHLEALIKSEKLDRQPTLRPEQWANESVRLAQIAWVPDGSELDESYYRSEIQVVDRQMALAGLRLANLLNETLGKMTPRDFAGAQPESIGPTTVGAQGRRYAGRSQLQAQVWVNPRSHVYHCPATQWYGKTARGEFMSEADAQKKGYRPAGGSVCQ